MTHSLPTLPTFGYTPADPIPRAYAAFVAAQTAWALARDAEPTALERVLDNDIPAFSAVARSLAVMSA